MSKSRIIITFGVIILLLPLLGFPRAWESFFQVVIGLGIVLISVWTNIDRKLTLRAKAHKRQIHKRRMAELGGEVSQQEPVENNPEPLTEEQY